MVDLCYVIYTPRRDLDDDFPACRLHRHYNINIMITRVLYTYRARMCVGKFVYFINGYSNIIRRFSRDILSITRPILSGTCIV